MLCQSCHQYEASVHLVKTINGQSQEWYLCENCAQKHQEVSVVFHPGAMPDFLQALFGFGHSVQGRKPEEVCPRCGMAFSQITQAGKLGCAVCYEKFEPQLESLLRRLHGSGQHMGKVPARRGVAFREKLELKNYKEKIKVLIEQEKFEEAAQLRDQIRQLEQNQKG